MSQRTAMALAQDKLEHAMIMLMQTSPVAPVSSAKVKQARAFIRDAQKLLEDSLSGPSVSRRRRIANEVAMTGLEQELPQ